jgi:hypothetical protein
MIFLIWFLKASNYLSGHPVMDIDLEERTLTKQQRTEEQTQRYMPVYRKLEALKRTEDEKHH